GGAQASSGHGRVVGVVGEPGVGKTRLCLELVRRCRARGAVLAQTHCPAHAANVAWFPIRELLRSLFDVHPEDAAEVSRRKIRRSLLQLSRSFSAALPLVFDVLEVADPAEPLSLLDEQRRAQLGAFLAHLLQAPSPAPPVVLFVDDAHCIDPDGEALIGDIVAALGWTR